MENIFCWIQRSSKEDSDDYVEDGFIIHIPGQGTDRFIDLDMAIAELERRLLRNTDITELELVIGIVQKEIELLEHQLETKQLELTKLEKQLDVQKSGEVGGAELIGQLKRALTLDTSLVERFGPVQYADLGYYFDEDGDGIQDLQIAWGWSKRKVPKLGWEN